MLTDVIVKHIQSTITLKNIYNSVYTTCNYMQALQKMMRIVISLSFCGIMPSSSAIVLRSMVGKVNEGVCVCCGGFWGLGMVSESDTRQQPPETSQGNT